jgi:hypothetical protein
MTLKVWIVSINQAIEMVITPKQIEHCPTVAGLLKFIVADHSIVKNSKTGV